MKEKKNVKLGIIGLGVVGSGLVTLILKNAARIASDTGVTIEIEKIFVRDITKKRDVNVSGLSLTTNIDDIIKNTAIDIVCECVGGNGCNQTYQYVLEAMKNGKHVIMSSKKALATHAESIVGQSRFSKVHFKYDATVGGGIPISKVLEQAFRGDKLSSIYGIFNATSNYIYSSMDSRKISFEKALQEAQEKGYAENDPSEDIDGIDAVNKLIILSFFGMKKIIHQGSIKANSFTNTNIIDVKYANELGFQIKPVAKISNIDNKFQYYAGPALVSEDHIIAKTANNFNVICLHGEHCGELGFYGQGAGGMPTASAMFNDLISILGDKEPELSFPYEKMSNDDILATASNYYFRFKTDDPQKDVSAINKIFEKNGMVIDRFIQKNENNENSDLLYFINDSRLNGIVEVNEELFEKGIKREVMMGVL